MPPKIINILRKLAEQSTPGPYTERGEFVMDSTMKAVVDAITAELGGRGARSKAVRYLIQKGAERVLAERTTQA